MNYKILVTTLSYFYIRFAYSFDVHRKFEYKYSFSTPHIVAPDGNILFWTFGGNALAAPDRLRLVPSLHSQKGWAWTKYQWENPNFELIVEVRINGQGKLGADGLVIWYTQNKGENGTTFGNSDYWNGLGVFLDTYDNDHKEDNPYIGVMVNDGFKRYDQATDGKNDIMGGCFSRFRNNPLPTFIKITYFNRVLTVTHANGASMDNLNFVECLKRENVILPAKGYFGVSAATGGLADDHDVLRFRTYSLAPKAPQAGQPDASHQTTLSPVPNELNQEFKEFYDKLNKKKEDYRKEHPDVDRQREPWEDEEDWGESVENKDLTYILEGQNRIEKTLSAFTTLLKQIASGQGGQHGAPPQNMLQLQEFTKHFNDIRYTLDSMSKQLQTVKGHPTYGDDVKEQLNHLRGSLDTFMHKQPHRECPKQNAINCLTSAYFFIFIIVQIILFASYIIYKNHTDQKNKKLF